MIPQNEYLEHRYYRNGDEEKKRELHEQGYTENGRTEFGNYWIEVWRTVKTPRYSSQCTPKCIGTDGVDSYSGTPYYIVTREEYERMEIKPQLSMQCKPDRWHDFDGFVEQVSTEFRSLGWVEVYGNDYDTDSRKRRVYFVVDTPNKPILTDNLGK